MDYHGIDMKGAFFAESLTTLPTWTSADERRLVYIEDVESFYFGTDSAWSRVLDSSFGQFVETDGDSAPDIDNTHSVGTPVLRFANIYAVTFRGNVIGDVTGNVTGTATAAQYS